MAGQPISVMTLVDDSSSSSTELVLTETNHGDDKNNNNNNNLAILDANDSKNNGGGPAMMKKKKKSTNILKVALMLLRRRSRKPNAVVVDVASKGMWNSLVGSIRPLHLQSNQSPPHDQQVVAAVVPPSSLSTLTEPSVVLHASPSVDSFEDVLSSSSSVDSMSRYASAANLQELDQTDDEVENNDKCNVNKNSDDEMIDTKAEMFIAQFYAQMKLQRSDSDVRYNEMIKRSIG